MSGKEKGQALYNANDGLTGRDGGPYLDIEEARQAEVNRARVEDREPDFDNMPASAGIVLVTAGQALANGTVNNLPSQSNNVTVSAEAALKGVADDDGNALKVHSYRPVEATEGEAERVNDAPVKEEKPAFKNASK